MHGGGVEALEVRERTGGRRDGVRYGLAERAKVGEVEEAEVEAGGEAGDPVRAPTRRGRTAPRGARAARAPEPKERTPAARILEIAVK
jgi:hypothetical protein